MNAISAGLIDARMDQQSKTVTVTRCAQREFAPAQWRQLKDRLDAWSGNVAAMLKSIEQRDHH